MKKSIWCRLHLHSWDRTIDNEGMTHYQCRRQCGVFQPPERVAPHDWLQGPGSL